MLRLSTKFYNQLTAFQTASFGSQKPKKVKTVHHRIKQYSKNPHYKLKTLIRPPDLNDPQLSFPIRIPIRYRHIKQIKKELFIDNSSKIHWNRLEPNQILLGLQNPQYLTFSELTEGLEFLSKVPTQEKYDWNEHEWVRNAMNIIRDKFNFIKKKEIMSYYRLMKRLRYSDEVFWQKMYAKIEQNIYDLMTNEFEFIYLEYYERFDKIFSENAKQNFSKLMQGRIREFKPESILKIFGYFFEEKKLDTYWLENVFISLFKDRLYSYNADQIGRIFRHMMIIGHEENERLYSNLYMRITKLHFKSVEEIENLKEVLEQVKQIFVSHRVEPSLQLLDQRIKQVQERSIEKKKTLQQMVKEDLKYFVQKRKLKEENSSAETI